MEPEVLPSPQGFGTFDGFGRPLLYPQNWTIAERGEDEASLGVTFDLPGGGFLTIETVRLGRSEAEVVAETAAVLKAEFNEIEQEAAAAPGVDEATQSVDFRFYYLDLLVVSRVVLIDVPPTIAAMQPDAGRVMLQLQAESREFEACEMMIAAMVRQLT